MYVNDVNSIVTRDDLVFKKKNKQYLIYFYKTTTFFCFDFKLNLFLMLLLYVNVTTDICTSRRCVHLRLHLPPRANFFS